MLKIWQQERASVWSKMLNLWDISGSDNVLRHVLRPRVSAVYRNSYVNSITNSAVESLVIIIHRRYNPTWRRIYDDFTFDMHVHTLPATTVLSRLPTSECLAPTDPLGSRISLADRYFYAPIALRL